MIGRVGIWAYSNRVEVPVGCDAIDGALDRVSVAKQQQALVSVSPAGTAGGMPQSVQASGMRREQRPVSPLVERVVYLGQKINNCLCRCDSAGPGRGGG